jgi:hypothetical protein
MCAINECRLAGFLIFDKEGKMSQVPKSIGTTEMTGKQARSMVSKHKKGEAVLVMTATCEPVDEEGSKSVLATILNRIAKATKLEDDEEMEREENAQDDREEETESSDSNNSLN